MLVRKNYPQLGEAVGPYVHAVQHNDSLHLSGLTAFGSPYQSAAIDKQAAAVFDQISAIADAEGISLAQLIKVTIFVTDLQDVGLLRQQLFELYGEHLPASSLVCVQQLFAPELKIEIEALLALNAH